MKWFGRREPTPEVAESSDEPGREFEDVLEEVQSVLRLQRWDVREAPFRGFGSQSGRF